MERIKQKLDVARKQRESIQHEYATSSDGVGHRTWRTFRSEKHRFMTLKDNYLRLLLVMAVIIMSIMIIWWGISSKEPDGIGLSGIDLLEAPQVSGSGNTAVEKLEVKITDLAKHVDVLTESITHLETKLISVHLITDSIIDVKDKQPPSSSTTQQTIAKTDFILETPPIPAPDTAEKGMIETKALHQSTDGTALGDQDKKTLTDASIKSHADTTGKPVKRVIEQPASNSTHASEAKEHQDSISNKQPATNMAKNGPWIINLVSTSSKADADRLAKKALSKNIQTEQQPITVKGTQYWRVQITGFSTEATARAYADTAKAQLGLKDVWIMKR